MDTHEHRSSLAPSAPAALQCGVQGRGGSGLSATGCVDGQCGAGSRLECQLLRRWVVEAEQTGSVPISPHRAPVESNTGFVPVPLISSPAEPAIRIELRGSRRGHRAVAGVCRVRVCSAAAGVDAVIRIDDAWVAVGRVFFMIAPVHRTP